MVIGASGIRIYAGGNQLGSLIIGVGWHIRTGLAGSSNTLLEIEAGGYASHVAEVDNVFCICLDDFPNTGVFMDAAGNPFTSAHSVAGKINKALSFDGSDDYIEVFDEGALSFNSGSQDFSIAIWIRRAGTGLEYIIDKRDGSFDGWNLFIVFGEKPGFMINAIVMTSDTGISDTERHLLIITVDRSSDAYMYLDNVEVAGPVAISGEVMDVANNLFIGQTCVGTGRFEGDIDVTAIFDKALSQAERDFIWNGSNGREGLVEAKTYHFATRQRNIYNLVSQNIASWDLEVDEDGNVQYTPDAPQKISIEPVAGAKGLVKAQYIYDPDVSNTATKWLIYFTDDGTDPDPDNDVPTEVTMYKSNGIAHLNWTSPVADDDDILKVLVRARTTIDSDDYDSRNTTIYSCTANDTGPAAPTGRAFFGKETEAM